MLFLCEKAVFLPSLLLPSIHSPPSLLLSSPTFSHYSLSSVFSHFSLSFRSVPAESASENRQLEVSESSVVSGGSTAASGLQSLGETQIEQLTSTTSTTLPLPSSSIATRTPSPLRSVSPRPVSGHVGADGTLDDDAINEIIADDNESASSSGELSGGVI